MTKTFTKPFSKSLANPTPKIGFRAPGPGGEAAAALANISHTGGEHRRRVVRANGVPDNRGREGAEEGRRRRKKKKKTKKKKEEDHTVSHSHSHSHSHTHTHSHAPVAEHLPFGPPLPNSNPPRPVAPVAGNP